MHENKLLAVALFSKKFPLFPIVLNGSEVDDTNTDAAVSEAKFFRDTIMINVISERVRDIHSKPIHILNLII